MNRLVPAPRKSRSFPLNWMANFFPRWANWIPLKLLLILAVVSTVLTLGIWYYFTPKYTKIGYMPDQPMTYSHAIHVEQLGLDCRYCHSFVEVAGASNVPSTQTCMACHAQIKAQSPKLAALRASWEAGTPVQWVRIHKAPDYVYFNHAVHVNRGVSCFSCHGQINDMPTVFQAEPLSMAWCLECHRAPEKFLRPPSEIYNLNWHPASARDQLDMGTKFKREWNVNPPVTCGGCHR